MKKLLTVIVTLITIQQIFANAPVHPFGDTLFVISHKLGSFSSERRAISVSDRIIQVAEKADFNKDNFTLSITDEAIDVMYQDRTLFSLFPFDTIGTGLQQKQVAVLYASIIRGAIIRHNEKFAVKVLMIKVGLTIAAIFLCLLIVWLINKGYNFGVKTLNIWKGSKIKSLKLNDYEFLNPERITTFLLLLLNVVRFLTIIVSVYLLLPLLFSIFPQTKEWADLLLGYIFSPIKSIFIAIVNYVPNIIRIIIVFLLTHYSIKGVRFLAEEIAQERLTIPGFFPDLAKPTFNIIRFLLYAFMLVIIFPYLPGSKSPAFQGVSVFLGLLISFGSSSAIANAVAGLVITYMRPFKIGDRVKIGEVSGDIIEKGMLVTRIRTIKNEEITIPNSSVLSNHSINYSVHAKDKGLILYTSVTIGYDAPWRTVHELLIKAALKTDMIVSDPKPFVFQTSLDDFYVSYQLNAYTKHPRRMAGIYSDLHQNIQDSFNEGGVEIMSPHYGALRNGNTTTIPENYRSSSYKADTFNIKNES